MKMLKKKTTFINILITTIFLLTPFSHSISQADSSKVINAEDIAKNTTVQVLPNGYEGAGSGVIIKREELNSTTNYLILTNAHVIGLSIGENCGNRPISKNIEIKTFDKKTHKATLHSKTKILCKNKDLAILQFSDDIRSQYQVAKVGSTDRIKAGEKVYISGFPCNSQCENQKIEILTGNLQKLKEPRKFGYQIGYGVNSKVGMSGGAVLTSQGQLIGINGKGSIDFVKSFNEDDYLIQGFRRVNPEEKKIIDANSWAIPSTAFLDVLTSDLISPTDILNRIEDNNKNLEEKINNIYLMILAIIGFLLLLLSIMLLRSFIRYVRSLMGN